MPISKTLQELPQQEQDQSPKDSSPPKETIEQNSVFLKAIAANDRLKICQECDKYLKKAKICTECKCFMPMKVRFRGTNCPLEKW